MKIFTNNNDEIVELNEVSILIEDVNELAKLQQFLAFCKEKIEKNELYHEHFNDFLDNYDNSSSDLIVVNQVK